MAALFTLPITNLDLTYHKKLDFSMNMKQGILFITCIKVLLLRQLERKATIKCNRDIKKSSIMEMIPP